MVAFNFGLGWIGSPRSRIAAIRQAAMSRAPRSRSSGIRASVGEQKANSQPRRAFLGCEVAYLHNRSHYMGVLSQPVSGFSPDTATDLSHKRVQKRLSPAARKAFFKIADAWKIRDEEAKQLL